MVPRMVAKVALVTAICSESTAAFITWSLLRSLPYHWVEKPPHTVASLDLLKEKTMSDRMGR